MPESGRKFRVVQWGTGTVGRHAICGILSHPELELAAVHVARPENAGKDAGELAGLKPCGITTTSNVEDILAMDADCVFYAGRAQRGVATIVDDICRLLRSGKNVVSIAASPLIYPKSLGGDVAERLEDACRAGNASFHGTGIEPGWASEVLPLTLSGLLYRIDRLIVQEIMDYSSYDNPEMLFGVMGFGRKPSKDRKEAKSAAVMPAFRTPLMMVADALGAKIDAFVFHFDAVLADRTFTVAAGEIAEGTVSALRFGVSAVIGGRAAMTVEHITRVGQGQAPDWPQGRGWRCKVEGLPSFNLEADIAVNPGEDNNDQACLATAMHGVNAIAPVCAAQPGIRTFLDLPPIVARGAFARS